MGLDLMSRLHHRIRHGLEDSCMSTWVDSGHGDVFKVRELLHGEGLVKIFALDVQSDVLVGNRDTVMASSAKVHARCVIVLVIYDVHLVVSVVLQVVLLLFEVSSLQHNDLLFAFLYHFVLHLIGLRLFQGAIESASAKILFEEQVLLAFIEVLASKFLVFRRLPLPSIADLDEVLSGALELVGRELSGLLEHVLLGRRTPFLADLLRQVVGDVLAPVPPAHKYKIIRYVLC